MSEKSLCKQIVSWVGWIVALALLAFATNVGWFLWQVRQFNTLQKQQFVLIEQILETPPREIPLDEWQESLALYNVWGNVTFFHTQTPLPEMRRLSTELEAIVNTLTPETAASTVEKTYDLLLTTQYNPDFISRYRSRDVNWIEKTALETGIPSQD